MSSPLSSGNGFRIGARETAVGVAIITIAGAIVYLATLPAKFSAYDEHLHALDSRDDANSRNLDYIQKNGSEGTKLRLDALEHRLYDLEREVTVNTGVIVRNDERLRRLEETLIPPASKVK